MISQTAAIKSMSSYRPIKAIDQLITAASTKIDKYYCNLVSFKIPNQSAIENIFSELGKNIIIDNSCYAQ